MWRAVWSRNPPCTRRSMWRGRIGGARGALQHLFILITSTFTTPLECARGRENEQKTVASLSLAPEDDSRRRHTRNRRSAHASNAASSSVSFCFNISIPFFFCHGSWFTEWDVVDQPFCDDREKIGSMGENFLLYPRRQYQSKLPSKYFGGWASLPQRPVPRCLAPSSGDAPIKKIGRICDAKKSICVGIWMD